VTERYQQEFSDFFEEVELSLRRALAAYGSDRGREPAAGALSDAWRHWECRNVKASGIRPPKPLVLLNSCATTIAGSSSVITPLVGLAVDDHARCEERLRASVLGFCI
jgi:hypothetical protein